MTSTREQLKEAYRLIRQDQPHEAEQLLRPILEAEPENVHAWWLLAYSVDDPYDVRDALNKVLELDPSYSNAPKAREMLTTLEEQFFSASASVPEGEFAADDSALDGFGEDDSDAAFEVVQGPGYDEDYSTVDASFFVEEDDALADFDEPLFEDEGAIEPDLFSEEGLDLDMDQDPDDLLYPAGDAALDKSDEDKASAEERVGRRAGRGGCVRIALLLVLIAVIAVAGFVLLTQDDEVSSDPGALVVVNTESADLANVVNATQADVTSAALGMQQKAVVAESPLGDTLFVEFCGVASSDLSQDIALAMQIAAQRVVDVSGSLDAIGVSVNRCDAEEHDTLYRVYVPIADAMSYLNGDFGAAQAGWAEFQSRWQKS